MAELAGEASESRNSRFHEVADSRLGEHGRVPAYVYLRVISTPSTAPNLWWEAVIVLICPVLCALEKTLVA